MCDYDNHELLHIYNDYSNLVLYLFSHHIRAKSTDLYLPITARPPASTMYMTSVFNFLYVNITNDLHLPLLKKAICPYY